MKIQFESAGVGDWMISPLEGGEQPVRAANSSRQWRDERLANAGTVRSTGDPAGSPNATEGVLAPAHGIDRPHPGPSTSSGSTSSGSTSSESTSSGSILLTRGREGAAYGFAIAAESAADATSREALLDRAMGSGRKRKSSEQLRRGRKPSEGLAFVARDADGRLVGTVRLWDLAVSSRPISPLEGGEQPVRAANSSRQWRDERLANAGTVQSTGDPAGAPKATEGVLAAAHGIDRPHPDPSTSSGSTSSGSTLPSRGREGAALLLGPLAVDPSLKGAGIGSALMRHAIEEAKRLGHRAILLVGDAPYYSRFGFSAGKTGSLAMPGPYERHRLLALELEADALDGAYGVLRAAGRPSALALPASPAEGGRRARASG